MHDERVVCQRIEWVLFYRFWICLMEVIWERERGELKTGELNIGAKIIKIRFGARSTILGRKINLFIFIYQFIPFLMARWKSIK